MTRSEPLRLLLTTDTVGGVWQYSLDLARSLGERDVATIIVTLGPGPSPAQRAEAAALPSATLFETDLPLDWLCDDPRPVRLAGEAVARLAEEMRVDLVQVNSPALAAGARPDVPVVTVAHGCLGTWWAAARPGEPLPESMRWHPSLVSQGLRRASRAVAPSSAYAGLVARYYELPQAPAVVHNGRHPLPPQAPAAMHDCALTVGRLWDRVKNTELLDRVAGRLAIPFLAAGPVEGPHGERVSPRHLHLLGTLDARELGRRMAPRPVFVSAACFEPFGLAVLEAAQAGCPLVLSDIAAFRELWDGAAVFVSRDDEAEYAEAIEAIVGDGLLRHRLGEAAAERARRYTPEATAGAMLHLYRGLLADPLLNRRAAA